METLLSVSNTSPRQTRICRGKLFIEGQWSRMCSSVSLAPSALKTYVGLAVVRRSKSTQTTAIGLGHLITPFFQDNKGRDIPPERFCLDACFVPNSHREQNHQNRHAKASVQTDILRPCLEHRKVTGNCQTQRGYHRIEKSCGIKKGPRFQGL